MAGEMIQKLQLKPGMRLALINPPQGMQALLAEAMPGVALTTDLSGQPEGVLAFVRSREELLALAPSVFDSVKPGGLAWIAFPKGGSGVAN